MNSQNHFFLFVLFLAINPFANSQEVISTQGDSYSSMNGSIDYSIGEVVINTVFTGSNDLTQGFHQTKWNFVGIEDNAIDIAVSVYPNPTSAYLYISTDYYKDKTYQLSDANGKIVRRGILSVMLTTIHVEDITPGTYNLSISDQNQTILKTYKLVKHY